MLAHNLISCSLKIGSYRRHPWWVDMQGLALKRAEESRRAARCPMISTPGRLRYFP
jgi:hypothetical protein